MSRKSDGKFLCAGGISGQIDFFCFADIATNQADPLRPEGSHKRFLTLDGAENNLKPS